MIEMRYWYGVSSTRASAFSREMLLLLCLVLYILMVCVVVLLSSVVFILFVVEVYVLICSLLNFS